MIIGLGIDAVHVERFNNWHMYSHKKLSRLFSDIEIAYCLQSPRNSAERFAIRFAAREAFFKAWHNAFPGQYIPLLRLCKAVKVAPEANGMPQITVDWQLLGTPPPPLSILLSLTHSDSHAIACVILQNTA